MMDIVRGDVPEGAREHGDFGVTADSTMETANVMPAFAVDSAADTTCPAGPLERSR